MIFESVVCYRTEDLYKCLLPNANCFSEKESEITEKSRQQWIWNHCFLNVSISGCNVDEQEAFDSTVDQDSHYQVLIIGHEVRFKPTIEGREQNIRFIHNALKRSLKAMDLVHLLVFLTQSHCTGLKNSFVTVISYCMDIREAKTIGKMKHWIMFTRKFHRCLGILDDFEKMKKATILHCLRTSLTCRDDQKLRTKIMTVDYSGDLHQVRPHRKKIKDAFKECSFSGREYFLRTTVLWSAPLLLTSIHYSL